MHASTHTSMHACINTYVHTREHAHSNVVTEMQAWGNVISSVALLDNHRSEMPI